MVGVFDKALAEQRTSLADTYERGSWDIVSLTRMTAEAAATEKLKLGRQIGRVIISHPVPPMDAVSPMDGSPPPACTDVLFAVIVSKNKDRGVLQPEERRERVAKKPGPVISEYDGTNGHGRGNGGRTRY